MTCKSLKGILVLFKVEQLFVRDTSKFYNPHIRKVPLIVEGKPDQLYMQGMQLLEQYDEICKDFAEGSQKDKDANETQKHLQLHDLSVGEYLTDKYSLDENALHGTGRRVENPLEGVTLQIEKSATLTGALKVYIYLIINAQLNIKDRAFQSISY